MKISSKLTAGLLSGIMAFGALTALPLTAGAAETTDAPVSSTISETESNNSYDTANTVTLGNTISGSLTSKKDADYYKIVSPEKGKISLSFNHKYEEVFGGWNVYIYMYTDYEYKAIFSSSIDFEDKEKVDLPCIGSGKNCTYFVKVCGSDAYGNTVDKNYTINTSFTSSDSYEQEINNDVNTANEISLDKSYGGNIKSAGDSDFYKITPSSSGKMAVTFEHKYKADSLSGWWVEVYTYEDSEYKKVTSKTIGLSDSEKVTFQVDVIENQAYYVEVCNANSLAIGDICYDLIGQEYTVTVSLFTGSFGDVNGDSGIDISDATAIQKAVAQITSLTDKQQKAADVNGDGKVDITDATMIQKYVAKIITSFTAA